MKKGNSEEVVITSEDLFDENKFVLDEGDNQRIEKNISFLIEHNIPYIKHMRTIPINKTTKLRNEEEILNKLIVDYTLSLFARYSHDKENKIINVAFNKIDERIGVRNLLTGEDISLIDDILDNKISEDKLEEISLKMESVAVYLWALGLINRPFSSRYSDANEITKILFKSKNYVDLLYRCHLKSKSEILEYADLICRYHYAVRYYKMNGVNQDILNESIIEKQHEALDYITSYNLDDYIKDKIKIKCEKKDLAFSFEIPSYLNFQQTENNRELLSLNHNATKISISDMGIASKTEFDEKVLKIERLYNSKGFSILNTTILSNDKINGEIIQLVIENYKVAFNTYLLLIQDHLIKIDSSIENGVDYKDYNMLVNSNNSRIDREILFSITPELKNETVIDKEDIKNEFDYSNIICNFSNVNKIIEFSDNISNRFNNLILNNKSILKKDYPNGLYIYLIDDNYNTKSFRTYDDYLVAYKEGFIKRIVDLSIEVNLNYTKDDESYRNLFKITIKPYNVKFHRKSNHNEKTMNQIEDSFNIILSKIPKEETIFK